MSDQKTKIRLLNEFEVKNVELFNLLSERRIMVGAIDHITERIEFSVEYNEETRVTYRKAMIRDETRDYRRERDLLNEQIEILRNEMFLIKERVSLS